MHISKIVFLALGLYSSPAYAQNIQITPEQLFAASAQALREGNPAAAANGADALLARNPSDINVLILRAEAAILQRDFATAVTMARRGFFASDSPGASFAAARLAALAHAEQGQFTRAQIWLRLARQYAPNEEAAASIATDYRFLRGQNPWSTSLRFGITPSSNINNGSASETTRLFGLPFDFVLDGEARALSGFEYSGGFTAAYRISASQTAATFFEIEANARTYSLSSEAQTQAPDAKGSDFSDATLSFGLTHRFIGRAGDEPSRVSASVGQNWYGGDPNTHFIEIAAAHAWRLSPADRVELSITTQRLFGDQDQETVDSYGVTGGWTHAFANGDQSLLSLGARESVSANADSDYAALRLVGGYSLAEPFMGVNFGITLDLEERRYDASRFSGGAARTDQSVSARLRMVLSEVEYFGFQPVVTLEGTRTKSDVDLFDRDYVKLGFDLQSSF